MTQLIITHRARLRDPDGVWEGISEQVLLITAVSGIVRTDRDLGVFRLN